MRLIEGEYVLVDDVGVVGCEGAVEDAVLNYEEATIYFIMVFAVCKAAGNLLCI